MYNESFTADNGDGTFNNPLIYADVPDMDIIKVGDAFLYVINHHAYVPRSADYEIIRSCELGDSELCLQYFRRRR